MAKMAMAMAMPMSYSTAGNWTNSKLTYIWDQISMSIKIIVSRCETTCQQEVVSLVITVVLTSQLFNFNGRNTHAAD